MLAAGKAALDVGPAGADLSRKARGSPAGETPPLQAGFAGLYRRSVCRSSRSRWTAAGCGAAACDKRAGTVHFPDRRADPAGPQARRASRRASTPAINALELSSRSRAPSFSAAATTRFEIVGDLLVGEALLGRLKRDLDRQRQSVRRLEPVEQAGGGDRLPCRRRGSRGPDRSAASSAGTMKAKSRVTGWSAGGANAARAWPLERGIRDRVEVDFGGDRAAPAHRALFSRRGCNSPNAARIVFGTKAQGVAERPGCQVGPASGKTCRFATGAPAASSKAIASALASNASNALRLARLPAARLLVAGEQQRSRSDARFSAR